MKYLEVANKMGRRTTTAQQKVAKQPDPNIDATDSAVELAEESGIDLGSVKGTGVDGRITKADVQSAIDAKA